MEQVRHKLQMPMDDRRAEELTVAIGLLGLLQDPAYHGKTMEQLAAAAVQLHAAIKLAMKEDRAQALVNRKRNL